MPPRASMQVCGGGDVPEARVLRVAFRAQWRGSLHWLVCAVASVASV